MKKPASLEKTLLRLEQIVASLDQDDLELEEALRLFEEGVANLRSAQSVLSSVQGRIERLIEEKGEPLLEPMPQAGEE